MLEERGFSNTPRSGEDDRRKISARLKEGGFKRSWQKIHLRKQTLGFRKLNK
jgi:hypothetical protein